MGSITASNSSDSLQQLRELRKRVGKEENINKDVKRALHDEARQLMLDMETPQATLTRTLWSVCEPVCLNAAMDMGALKYLANASEPQSLDTLARECNVEPLLMQRILRVLEAFGDVGVAHVNDETRYSANATSRLYTTDCGISHMQFVHGILHPGWIRFASKLKANNFRSPTNSENTVFSDLHGKYDTHFWNLLTPLEIQTCQVFMPNFNPDSPSWLDIYPVKDRLIEGAKAESDAVLFVDVGGSGGAQALELRRRYPDAPGRLINQDLAAVVHKSEEGLESMPHNFFHEQPVQGARAYFLRYVMHDWSQDNNIKILSRLRDAMEPGYSRVVISEWVIPKQGASMFMAGQDMNMMAHCGGEERDEDRHRAYIEAAGLKITGIWDLKDGASVAVIECSLASDK